MGYSFETITLYGEDLRQLSDYDLRTLESILQRLKSMDSKKYDKALKTLQQLRNI